MKNLVLLTMFLIVVISPAGAQSPALDEPSRTVEGTWEGELQTERWPVYLSIDLTRDEDVLTGSVAVLGSQHPLSEANRDGDLLRLALGSGAGALVLEGSVASGRFIGKARQGDDVMPFVFERVEDYPPPADRLAAWNQDLDALEQRFLRFDRSFTPAARELFREQIARLRNELGTLHDNEIMMRIASAVSLSDNAHTRLYLLRNRTELRRLPVRLWWFSDGLYIVRTTPEHRALLGCRVDRIGNAEARHARDVVSAAFAGNPSWTDYKSVYFLTSPEALHGFGITPDSDSVRLAVSRCSAAGSPTLEPLPLVRKGGAVEAWWDLSPRHENPEMEWTHVLDGSATVPLYLRHPGLNYWYEFLPDTGIFYFQYNRSADAAAESTKEFTKRLLEDLDKRPVKGFVIDLRFNTGGNLDLAAELMKSLLERTGDMPRWVITGRATFSAGITHAASWREAGDVTFVGEPVGDVLDFWSEGGNIILPNSRLYGHFANGAHSYSTRPCPQGVPCLDRSSPSLHPDVPVMSTWGEYVSLEDPAMEAILARAKSGNRSRP